MLSREEYVEQAYFFKTLRERMDQDTATQELLFAVRNEILTTTQLPLAIEFMTDELKHTGGFATAMGLLSHYFTSFQTYVMGEAERPEGRFDFRIALEILHKEAEYRASDKVSAQGVFLFQFESLCRNRLGYDTGLEAMSRDPIYHNDWSAWLLSIRHQVGIIDLCDLIYMRSDLHRKRRGADEAPTLFGEKEGLIAWANRRKDPLYLFSALQRHLGYPPVPRPVVEAEQEFTIPLLHRQVLRLETRIRLLEEEVRGGINISKYYVDENGKKKSK